MDVKIKRRHAENGDRNSAHSCPTALALLESGFKTVEVSGIVCVDIDNQKGHAHGQISRKLSAAIVAFDEGGAFPPGTYRIPGLKRPKKGGSR